MIIVILYNSPASVKGVVSRYLNEISTGVYIGNMAKSMQEEIWGFIRGNIGRGTGIIAKSNNSVIGYEIETINMSPKEIISKDGIDILYNLNSEDSDSRKVDNWSKQGRWAKWKK